MEEEPGAMFVTSASVEDADASISAVMDLISSQSGVAVRFDPHSRHGVIEDLIVLDEAETCDMNHQDQTLVSKQHRTHHVQ